MNKCIRFVIEGTLPKDFLTSHILHQARHYQLEGIAQQLNENSVRVLACGTPDQLDNFLDELHRSLQDLSITPFDVIPFLKDRDFRGVFRIIE